MPHYNDRPQREQNPIDGFDPKACRHRREPYLSVIQNLIRRNLPEIWDKGRRNPRQEGARRVTARGCGCQTAIGETAIGDILN
jgi:hypothetical protein